MSLIKYSEVRDALAESLMRFCTEPVSRKLVTTAVAIAPITRGMTTSTTSSSTSVNPPSSLARRSRPTTIGPSIDFHLVEDPVHGRHQSNSDEAHHGSDQDDDRG